MTLLLSLLFGPQPEPRPHYSGSFGDTTQDLIPYDHLTQAQHEELAAFWTGC